MQAVLNILPKTLVDAIQSFSIFPQSTIEEIRIRIHRPLEVIAGGRSYICPHVVQTEEGVELLNKLSQYSLYTIEEELKKGYITIQGGHRVGLAGKVIVEDGKVKAIRHITSFNIRMARQQIGIAEPLLPYLYDGRWMNTIIIGAPQTGKTTLLRDIARIVSSGVTEQHIAPRKVGIVDERSEIAGCVKGIPQFTFGCRVDVLDACPKAEGMMMMIRSMSPDVLIVDEIGSEADCTAILEAVHAGVGLFMTAHGRHLDDLMKRPSLRPIIEQAVFERFVELTNIGRPGTIQAIRDSSGRDVYRKMSVM
ncbi:MULTISPECIES: stage III sporulation protein AA [Anoxybacillus]|uniref:Stage III sporulation protein AA n=1 Tax=Anoxybacillus kestanbolensis TaxID=227476 RepID=A0A1V3FTL0_9BACL|nr:MULTISPECIES: stage III sporulation protein AA [Anoxybacillus]NNU89122.1 stage III sporulation protein AA [Anoxybacillus sp. CHMUD]OOE04894.1 stage III sporulation protein AA [Anoxybacillus kestanbolensis]